MISIYLPFNFQFQWGDCYQSTPSSKTVGSTFYTHYVNLEFESFTDALRELIYDSTSNYTIRQYVNGEYVFEDYFITTGISSS